MGPPGRSAAVSRPNQEAWLPGPPGPQGPGLPVLATGGRRQWDVPPTVTLGQDLQQGRHDRDWIGSFCCRFWLLQILKPSQRHFIHLPNACAARRRGTRAELHLNCKRPQLFPGEHPVAHPKRSPSGSSLHCAAAVGRRCDDTTGTTHCFINFMPRARPAGKDSTRTISHARK